MSFAIPYRGARTPSLASSRVALLTDHDKPRLLCAGGAISTPRVAAHIGECSVYAYVERKPVTLQASAAHCADYKL